MSLKRAPRREVMAIARRGNYPNVQWEHMLECGHLEVRKRKAPAKFMACSECLTLIESVGTTHADPPRPRAEDAPRVFDYGFSEDPTADVTLRERQVAIAVARALNVPLDAVEALAMGEMTMVKVMLEAGWNG